MDTEERFATPEALEEEQRIGDGIFGCLFVMLMIAVLLGGALIIATLGKLLWLVLTD